MGRDQPPVWWSCPETGEERRDERRGLDVSPARSGAKRPTLPGGAGGRAHWQGAHRMFKERYQLPLIADGPTAAARARRSLVR